MTQILRYYYSQKALIIGSGNPCGYFYYNCASGIPEKLLQNRIALPIIIENP